MSRIEIIETEKMTIKIVERKSSRTSREFHKATRVHIWGIENLTDIASSEAALPIALDKGECKANDAAYAKHNRLYAKRSREWALKAVSQAGGYLQYFGPAGISGRFSRTAGCSCPCSPGIILNKKLNFISFSGAGVDIYVTLK